MFYLNILTAEIPSIIKNCHRHSFSFNLILGSLAASREQGPNLQDPPQMKAVYTSAACEIYCPYQLQ